MRKVLQSGFAVFGACLAVSTAIAQPASSPSDETKRFVALALAGGSFIDEAGNTAIANGGSPALQKFARSAIAEQRAMRQRLEPWRYVLTAAPAEPIIYQGGMWDHGPIGLAFLPLNVAVAATSFVVYRALGVTSGGVILETDAQAQLEWMQGLSGAEFNAAYRASQAKAYHSLLDLYRGYERSGDDPVIRRLAAAEVAVLARQARALPRRGSLRSSGAMRGRSD